MAQWEQELRAAHELTYAKLTKRTREVLAIPESARKMLIRDRRKILAARAGVARATRSRKSS